jgi:hypothetical protein
MALACGLILAFPVLAMPSGFAAVGVVAVLIVRRARVAERGAIGLASCASPSP